MDTLGLVVRKLPLYSHAIQIAEKAHEGQMYGSSSKPYMYHLLNVARIVRERNHMLDDEKLDKLMAVAILHDVLEDTSMKFLELMFLINSHSVASAVEAMTKREEEKRRTYLKRCAYDPIALEVKICDTLTNLEHSVKDKSFKRIEKYSDQLRYLNERQRQESQNG